MQKYAAALRFDAQLRDKVEPSKEMFDMAVIKTANPFSLTIQESKPSAYDEMSIAAVDQMMAAGLARAKADDSFDMDEVFEELEGGLES